MDGALEVLALQARCVPLVRTWLEDSRPDLPREQSLGDERKDHVAALTVKVVSPLSNLAALQDHIDREDVEADEEAHIDHDQHNFERLKVHTVWRGARRPVREREAERDEDCNPRRNSGDAAKDEVAPLHVLTTDVRLFHRPAEQVHGGIRDGERNQCSRVGDKAE